MSQLIATILVVIVIVGLLVLDRDGDARTSKALWVPFVYFLILASRAVSSWFGDKPDPVLDAVNGVYSSPIDETLSLVLLALGLMILIARWRKLGSLAWRSGPIVLFYAYAAFSIFWSDLPYVTFKHWTKAVEDLVMVLIVWTDIDPAMAIKRLLSRAGFLLIPVSLLFSRYYPSFGRGFDKSWATYYIGVGDAKNKLGVICLIVGLTSLWCFLEARGERKRKARRRHLLAHGIMLGLVVVMFMMAHSATSSVCFVLSGAVMLVIRRSPGGHAVRVHLAVAAAFCCAVIPLFIAPSLVKSVGRSTTFSGRTVIWHILPQFVRDPWLGAGYETFLVGPRLLQLKAIIDNSFQEAHDGYLEVWLNLGWIGVLLFALLVIAGYRNALAAFRRDPAIGSLRLAFFVAVMIEGLTEAPFRMMSPTWFLLLWAMIDDSVLVRPSHRRVRQRHSVWFATPEPEFANEAKGIGTSVAVSSDFTETNQPEPSELIRR